MELVIIIDPAHEPAPEPDSDPGDPQQWRAVFEAVAARSHDAVMVCSSTAEDPVIRIRYVNERFVTNTGYAREELVGQAAGVLVGTDTNLDDLREIEAGLQEGETVARELVLERKDGQAFRAETTYSRTDGADGSTWYVATYHDLSEKAAAEEALWRSEEWAQALIRGISDIIVVTDEASVVRWVSPSLSRWLGYEPEEMIGTRCLDLVHPDDVDFSSREWGHVLRDHQREYEPTIQRIRHKDGSYRRLSVSASNQVEHPAIRGIVITASDVTARAEAEELLRQREQWAQALVAGGSDLVLVCDETGVITYASPALEEILGYPPEEFLGATHVDMVHPDDLDEARNVFGSQAPDPTLSGSHEFRVRHSDGHWRILNVVMTNMLDNPAVKGLVVNVRDVTSRRVVEDLLSEQADLLEAIARGAPLEITLQKITQMIEHVISNASCSIGILDADGAIRVRAAPSLPRQIVSLLDDLDPESAAGLEVRASQGEAIVYDLLDENPLGSTDLFAEHGFVLCRKAPVLAPGSGELLGALTVFHPNTERLSRIEADLLDRALNLAAIAIERRRFESTLEYQALYDPLTGLPNRTLLHSRIKDALTRAGRLDTGVAILFIDLDRFKVINDSVGHALGDQLLMEVTERFKEPLRPGDTLGRFGGDEFMIVCSRVPNEAAAAAAAERFMAKLKEPIRIDGGEIFVTASIGIAFADDTSVTAESLVRNADVAMYRAKDQGRNQLVVFQANLDLQAVEQLALEQALRHAIDNREFELHFQPVVRLSDGAMTHVEALVRWHRPGQGMVMPGVFIPLAEETGLIVPMGWLILEEACRQAAAWPDLPGGERVEIAVNLSAKQLASPDLMPTVLDVLDRTGLNTNRLCFEVTESALVHDVEQAKAALLKIKELGFQIAIDDFGTGYASLDYVRHFSMADYLKIDRSFVEGVDKEGSQEAAIVTAAIALAKSLGLTVVAEGVETLFQMEALRELDCDLAQGYLFSRPVPIDAAIELLASQPA